MPKGRVAIAGTFHPGQEHRAGSAGGFEAADTIQTAMPQAPKAASYVRPAPAPAARNARQGSWRGLSAPTSTARSDRQPVARNSAATGSPSACPAGSNPGKQARIRVLQVQGAARNPEKRAADAPDRRAKGRQGPGRFRLCKAMVFKHQLKRNRRPPPSRRLARSVQNARLLPTGASAPKATTSGSISPRPAAASITGIQALVAVGHQADLRSRANRRFMLCDLVIAGQRRPPSIGGSGPRSAGRSSCRK